MTSQPPQQTDQSEHVVVIDGRRYIPDPTPSLMDEPDLPNFGGWIPAKGDTVWLSSLSDGGPLGVVIGFLDQPGSPRHGQPVVEYQGPDEEGWLARKRGDRRIVHPHFIWPFQRGSDEHKAPQAAGLIRG